MKIMDVPSDDGECQIEAVIPPSSKKSKQARLPFQTLSSDSPITNKKRKPTESVDARKTKVAKVNTKENLLKTSNKTDVEEIVIDDETVKEDKEDKKADDESLQQSNETSESKKKKSTPGRPPKSKKIESKVQLTPLTRFFKKCDDKDKIQKNEESKKESTVNSSSKLDENPAVTKDQSDQQEKETSKKLDEKLKESTPIDDQDDSESEVKEDVCSDEDSKDSSSSDEDEQVNLDSSSIKDDEKGDADSDINLLDDSTSDTDKRTEHEDTDSKDDIMRNPDAKRTQSNKLLDSSKSKKLTPKQIEKKLESQKKREMREKQRLEREKKLQEERESRKKEKEEKKREREEKEKVLKEQKKKEKELKEQKKQAELELKQKEKEAKEEDRRKKEEAKEEERRKKEEERLEAERKKQKLASSFVSFFVSKKPSETKPAKEEIKVVKSNFMPFEVKADMRISPVTRRNLTDEEKSEFDKLISKGAKPKSELYLDELVNKKFNVRKSERTWPVESNDEVVVIEDEEEASSNVVQASNVALEKHRAKLLLFAENRRPPYWGTWRKKSKTITPRRPLATDTKWFDYEVDSDDEWEEEEPGESLRGSDDEKEEDPEDNEYDVDNDFMVPHGYLSDEEIMADEEECDEDDDLSPEKQTTKLKILNEQFEAERKQKTTKLHPKVIGCFWLKADNTYPDNTPGYAVRFLSARQAWVREVPVSLTPPAESDLSGENAAKHAAASARKAETLEEAVPDLIRLLHGNPNSQKFLAMEFLEYWSKRKADKRPLPKMRLKEKIRELASYAPCPEPGPMHEKSMWYVPEEVRKKYLPDETLSLPNCWTYSLTPKKKIRQLETKDKQQSEKSEDVKEERKTLPRITQFTKTLTAEEMQKQLAEKPATPSTSKSSEKPPTSTPETKATPPGVKPAKRVALISLPRDPLPKSSEKPLTSTPVIKSTPPGVRPPKRVALISLPRDPLPKSPRVSLIDKFVTKDSSDVAGDKKVEKKLREDSDDDIEIIDNSDEIDIASVTAEPESKGNDSTDKSESKNEDEKINKTGNTSCNSDVEIMEV